MATAAARADPGAVRPRREQGRAHRGPRGVIAAGDAGQDDVEIGRRCRIRRAIIDKNVVVPPNTTIGIDPEEDRRRFHVTPGGVVVIPKGMKL